MRESGAIVKCFDEMCEDFLVSDELRKVCTMILNPYYTYLLCVCVCVTGTDNEGE